MLTLECSGCGMLINVDSDLVEKLWNDAPENAVGLVKICPRCSSQIALPSEGRGHPVKSHDNVSGKLCSNGWIVPTKWSVIARLLLTAVSLHMRESLAPIRRSCECCKKTWLIDVTADAGLKQIRTQAQSLSHYNGRYRDSVGVLCPHCRQFSSRAKATHLPNGERETVLLWLGIEKLKKGIATILLPTVLIVAGWAIGAAFQWGWRGGWPVDGRTVAAVTKGLGIMIGIGIFIHYIYYLVKYARNASVVIQRLNDVQIHDFLVQIYSNDSVAYLGYGLAAKYGGWAYSLVNYANRDKLEQRFAACK